MCPAIFWRRLRVNYLPVQAADGKFAGFDGRQYIRLVRSLIRYVMHCSSLLLVFAQDAWAFLTQGCEALFRLRFQNLQSSQAVSFRL